MGQVSPLPSRGRVRPEARRPCAPPALQVTSVEAGGPPTRGHPSLQGRGWGARAFGGRYFNGALKDFSLQHFITKTSKHPESLKLWIQQ